MVEDLCGSRGSFGGFDSSRFAPGEAESRLARAGWSDGNGHGFARISETLGFLRIARLAPATTGDGDGGLAVTTIGHGRSLDPLAEPDPRRCLGLKALDQLGERHTAGSLAILCNRLHGRTIE
jgi:hypothetical protein